MIDGGVPITDALETISEDVDCHRLREVLRDVVKGMRTGETFHESLSRHPKVFNNLFCAMIQAGETGGTMQHVLQRMADYYDRRDEMKRKIKKAMAYPMFVVCFIMLVILALMLFVIPRFEEIFASFGGRLPAFTVAFMAAYKLGITYAPFLVAALFGLIFLAILYGKTKIGHRQYSWIALRAPLFGRLLHYAFLATWGRTMSSLLDAGVSIIDAQDIINDMTTNDLIRDALNTTHDQIAEGMGIAASMTGTEFFPRLMTKMVQVGEESGSLPNVLERVSTFYDKRVDTTVTTMITLLEPALLVMVGGIVLVVLFALYLPVFQISGMGM
jgi:type IV pilus assembly protein PilC